MNVKQMTDNDLVAQCAKINLKSNDPQSLTQAEENGFDAMWDELCDRHGASATHGMIADETSKLRELVTK